MHACRDMSGGMQPGGMQGLSASAKGMQGALRLSQGHAVGSAPRSGACRRFCASARGMQGALRLSQGHAGGSAPRSGACRGLWASARGMKGALRLSQGHAGGFGPQPGACRGLCASARGMQGGVFRCTCTDLFTSLPEAPMRLELMPAWSGRVYLMPMDVLGQPPREITKRRL